MIRTCAILCGLLVGACTTGPSDIMRTMNESASPRCTTRPSTNGGSDVSCALWERTTTTSTSTTTVTGPDGSIVSETTTTTLPNGDTVTTTRSPQSSNR